MSFLKHFADSPDPRSHINLKHELLDVVFLCVCAVLSGAEGWMDIKKFGDEKLNWLRKFRRFEHGIPADDSIARIIGAVDPHKMNACFVDWVNEIRSQAGGINSSRSTARPSATAMMPNPVMHCTRSRCGCASRGWFSAKASPRGRRTKSRGCSHSSTHWN
ncbi:MAG: ISAs1 family transposase [Gammaproteobacteria bacterium]|nr:ISAs1 family transposase [Gammaproteobacteria bacterium]